MVLRILEYIVGFAGYKNAEKKKAINFIADNLKLNGAFLIIGFFAFSVFAPQTAKDFLIKIIEVLKN